MSTQTATQKGNKKSETAKAQENGQETKVKKEAKTFTEMTIAEKVQFAAKSAISFAKTNNFKDITLDVTDENGKKKATKVADTIDRNEYDENGKVTGQITDDDFNFKVERAVTVRAYPSYRAKDSKIASLDAPSFEKVRELAKASLVEQKAKKYGKATVEFVNHLLRMKGAPSVKGFNAEVIQDLEL